MEGREMEKREGRRGRMGGGVEEKEGGREGWGDGFEGGMKMSERRKGRERWGNRG